MIYLVFLIYNMIISGQSVLNKIYRQSVDDDNMKDCITFLVTMIVEIVFYSMLSGFKLGVNLITIFYAILFATAVAINTLVSMRALEKAELVVSSLFSGAGGTVGMSVLGALIFKEELTGKRLIGLTLILLTVLIPFFTAKKSKTGKTGIFWCTMMFFTASLPTLVLKFYSLADGVLGDNILCFYTNIVTIPFILYLLRKKGTIKDTVTRMVTQYKKSTLVAVAATTATCISTLMYMSIVAMQDLIVISIISRGFSLITLLVFGVMVFKEKVTVSKLVCIAISILAVAVTI